MTVSSILFFSAETSNGLSDEEAKSSIDSKVCRLNYFVDLAVLKTDKRTFSVL